MPPLGEKLKAYQDKQIMRNQFQFKPIGERERFTEFKSSVCQLKGRSNEWKPSKPRHVKGWIQNQHCTGRNTAIFCH